MQPLDGLLHRGGFDEGDEITGSGSAELNDDGTIEVAFADDLGDEAVRKAERMTSSTACQRTLEIARLALLGSRNPLVRWASQRSDLM